jgi:hypothetical protein
MIKCLCFVWNETWFECVFIRPSDRIIAIIAFIIEYDLYITYLLMRQERNTYANTIKIFYGLITILIILSLCDLVEKKRESDELRVDMIIWITVY